MLDLYSVYININRSRTKNYEVLYLGVRVYITTGMNDMLKKNMVDELIMNETPQNMYKRMDAEFSMVK